MTISGFIQSPSAELLLMVLQLEPLLHIGSLLSLSQWIWVMFRLLGLRGLCWACTGIKLILAQVLGAFYATRRENLWPTLALFMGALEPFKAVNCVRTGMHNADIKGTPTGALWSLHSGSIHMSLSIHKVLHSHWLVDWWVQGNTFGFDSVGVIWTQISQFDSKWHMNIILRLVIMIVSVITKTKLKLNVKLLSFKVTASFPMVEFCCWHSSHKEEK